MIFQNIGIQLNNIQIEEFEKELSITLPQDYKDFMLKNNGGYVVSGGAIDFIEEPNKNSTNTIIQYFTMIDGEEVESYLDLKSSYVALIESGQTPPGLLPIADDVCGNMIVMSVAEKDYGKVCFANHEMEDLETGYIIMSPIADSFSEFIEKCYEYTDE